MCYFVIDFALVLESDLSLGRMDVYVNQSRIDLHEENRHRIPAFGDHRLESRTHSRAQHLIPDRTTIEEK